MFAVQLSNSSQWWVVIKLNTVRLYQLVFKILSLIWTIFVYFLFCTDNNSCVGHDKFNIALHFYYNNCAQHLYI